METAGSDQSEAGLQGVVIFGLAHIEFGNAL